MAENDEHVILVAIQVTSPNRHSAMARIMEALPRVGNLGSNNPHGIECWWVAEDDRTDGSDCDSAVFVHPGAQAIAVDLLHGMDLTADCNLSMGGNSIFEQP